MRGEGYRKIAERCESVEKRINSLPRPGRAAIAVSAAQRLMKEHLVALEDQTSTFTVGWAPYLDLIWRVLSSPSEVLDRDIRDKLDDYYSGPFCHELGEDALDGADEDAAAAAIYAVEAYCQGTAKSATSGTLRLLSAADMKAALVIKNRNLDLMSPEAEEIEVEAEDAELKRIEGGLEILEQQGVTPASIKELHRNFGIGQEQ